MKEYIEKLYTKLHEAMEKPVTLGSAEEVGLYAKTICRLEKLHRHHDEPETATFDRETAMQWAANMQNADGRIINIAAGAFKLSHYIFSFCLISSYLK